VSDILYFEDFPVGKTFEFGRYEISAAQIDSYAAEFNPDAMRGEAAPSLQLCALLMRMNFDGWMSGTAARGAPGVDEVQWLEPVRAGDALRCRVSVLKARISQSKPELGFVQFRHELINDLGKLAMTQTNYVMFARRDDADRESGRPAQKKASAPAASAPAAQSVMPTIWTEQVLGRRIDLGTTEFSSKDIVAFARVYDPQSFHVDEVAAKSGPFGALAASGWHTASAWMNAYGQAFQRSGAIAGRLASIANLRWLRPTYAGDTIAWDFTPVGITDRAAGTAVTSQNGGTNQHGVRVFDFSATIVMPLRDRM
jgi:acyl dehydratase